MRHHCRTKAVRSPRNTSVWLSLVAGVSVLAMSVADPAFAQNEFVVDISDPNVSVDLSVLNDGGLAPRIGAPIPAATSATATGGLYRAPGPNAPVSTLYIQPTGSFTLPPQTKALIAAPAPEPAPTTDVAEQAPVAPAPKAPVAPEPQAVAETAPVPEPVKAQEPAPAKEIIKEVAKAEPAPAPTPDPAPVKAEAAPAPAAPAPEPVQAAPAPEPAPVKKVVDAAKAEQTPPPPPQALTQAPASIDETQTAPQAAPAAKPGAVVVDLPPKLEETQPGVASLTSPTGPLGDGDSMRIVFEHDSSKLPSDAREALKTLSDRMGQQDNLRLQLLAYAGDTDTSASAARRLSLSRALAVRSYLIENGVRSTRIDVRALGNKSTEEVTERVDITVVER